jgi:2-dehydro-3-deoxygluconokinase
MKPVAFASIGECMIELSAGRAADWRMGFAGDTFNTAWYVRALLLPEKRVAYVTALGTDPFSAAMHAFFAQSGIATDRIRRVTGRGPGLYAITLEEAERAFTYWRGESAARCLADDSAWLDRALAKADLLYFSGVTLGILAPAARRRLMRAIAARRKAGATIAFDPNYRPVLWPDRKSAAQAVEAAYAIADIALPTRSDATALFGDRSEAGIVRRLENTGIGEFVLKDGDKPALVSGAGRQGKVPPAKPRRLLDTTGAGDSFSGAYLAGRLSGLDPFRSARLGHAVAAEVVCVHGALAKIDGLALLAGMDAA